MLEKSSLLFVFANEHCRVLTPVVLPGVAWEKLPYRLPKPVYMPLLCAVDAGLTCHATAPQTVQYDALHAPVA